MEEKKTFEILTEDLNSSQIPLRLVSTPHAGRCLVATRDIAKGEELFKEKRLVHGPPQGRTLCCVNCSRLIDLSKSLTNTDCRECGLPLCSESCPDTFGRVHEEDCEFFRKVDLKKSHIRLAPKWLTAFRVLQIIKKSPKIWKKLQLLEDHLEERRNTELMEINRTEVFDVLNELFPDENYDEETVMRICGILDGNAFR